MLGVQSNVCYCEYGILSTMVFMYTIFLLNMRELYPTENFVGILYRKPLN